MANGILGHCGHNVQFHVEVKVIETKPDNVTILPLRMKVNLVQGKLKGAKSAIMDLAKVGALLFLY